MKRRREVPTLVGIKFTDNDLVKANAACTTNAEGDRGLVFLGCDSLLLPAFLQGIDSAIGTTLNMFPELNNKILR